MTASDLGPQCLCGASGPEIGLIGKPDFGERKLYRCTRCSTAQFFPLPVAKEDLHEIYQSDAYLGNISAEEYKGYFTFFKSHLMDRLGVTPDARLLDFGAGKCYYHKFFTEAGFGDVHSLEINETFVRFARQELGLRNVHTDNTALAPESFDVVISNQVFEHLADPIAMLREVILPLVKPGGRVVFAVPNWASWNRPILGRRWVGYCPMDHIWFLSPKAVPILLRNVPGITIEDITVDSAVGKPYCRFRPQSMIKRAYLKLVWEPIEKLGKGDQLIVSVRKDG